MDHSHPSTTQNPKNRVAAILREGASESSITGGGLGGNRLQEIEHQLTSLSILDRLALGIGGIGTKQSFDQSPLFIALARSLQEPRALDPREEQRASEDLDQSLVSSRTHTVSGSSNRIRSQASANRDCSLRVRAGMSRTLALSSMVRPPKYRSSMIRA